MLRPIPLALCVLLLVLAFDSAILNLHSVIGMANSLRDASRSSPASTNDLQPCGSKTRPASTVSCFFAPFRVLRRPGGSKIRPAPTRFLCSYSPRLPSW
jgi:hypothetical protein